MSSLTYVLGATLWPTITREARTSKSRAAAVAYVTDVGALPFSRGDTLVLDASEHAIKSGSTDVKILETLLERGVKLYSMPNLHAKVYVFDNTAIVGSSNLSHNSRNLLRECALLTHENQAVNEARALVHALSQEAESIDQEFITNAKKIEVIKTNYSPIERRDNGQRVLWYLEKTPDSRTKSMRAYFIALILAQIGDLAEDRPFLLWPSAHISGHEKEERISRVGRCYQLEKKGIEYFSSEGQWPDPRLLASFLTVVTEGDKSALPADLENTNLLKMYLN